jgi:myosin heavy subunit
VAVPKSRERGGTSSFILTMADGPSTTPSELGMKKLALMHGECKVGDPVWVILPGKKAELDDMYHAAKLEAVATGGKVSIKLLATSTTMEMSMSLLLPGNLETGREDICSLMHLNEATILDNVQTRFAKKLVYTWTSTILIAMNPFESRPELYNEQEQLKYSQLAPRSAPPHVYAIVEAAFRGIQLRSQTLIVSGESGAGKTFTNRIALAYLRFRSGSNNGSDQEASGAVSRVMADSNPVTEAFGNAKTTRNNNSSRFGKFARIYFTKAGAMRTVQISTYLLESARVASIISPERNYHIFYM